ncbi:MAG: hypothetical protein U9O87_02820 [Verrucomicrobiota bacterium]|nr:hypothetical protein [Verrucomicrobiota bacterium]
MKLRYKIRYPFEYFFIFLCLTLTGFLPYPISKFIASFIGIVLYYTVGNLRRTISTNLQIAFPSWSDKRIKHCTKKNLKHTILTAFEFSYFMQHKEEFLQRLTVDDNLLEALSTEENKGFIATTPHLGNWELGSLALTLNGIKTAVVAKKIRNIRLDKLIKNLRLKSAEDVIYGKGAVRNILKALKRKTCIAMLIDQTIKVRKGGVFINFFGLPCPTTESAASIALKTSSDIIVVALIREENQFRFIGKKLQIKTDSPRDLTQEIVHEYENLIKKYPEQWMWSYKRWQYIPKDYKGKKEYPFYAKRR